MHPIRSRSRETALEKLAFLVTSGLLAAVLSAQVYFVSWLLALP